MLKADNTLEQWMNGIAYEVAFWNNVYRWTHTFRGMMNWSGFGSAICLEEFDANSFLAGKVSRKVLDVGCGMSYATGNFVCVGGHNEPLDIHYVDPLAPYFNQILNRYRRELPDIEFGMMEYLSAYCPQHDADLVVIQNALDHSARPVKGIMEALDTLRPEGILYLNHHPNEAETEHYKGFHQFNITLESGHLIVWNKQDRWDINELTGAFADTEVRIHNNGHIVAMLRKTADVPPELLCDKHDKQALAQMLMADGMRHRRLSAAIGYRLSYWKYNTIQFFAQSLPWSMKMKIKKLIGQT